MTNELHVSSGVVTIGKNSIQLAEPLRSELGDKSVEKDLSNNSKPIKSAGYSKSANQKIKK